MHHQVEIVKKRFGITGQAEALDRAIQVALRVAPTQLSVLIRGENGSGKESFSKLIHHYSPYKHSPFVAVNCGALPEGTIDAELFGHEKGSFTGAQERRKGYFEAADGGTIFLDEIGEMPLGTQSRLLRVLEYGEFMRVGSSKVEKASVRVLAATHVDLLEAVRQGRFREDLYYRLNTVPLVIPALRERGTDILLLFRRFALDFAEQYKSQRIELTPSAQQLLCQYWFPGNIRELKNMATQLSLLEKDTPLVTRERLQAYLPEHGKGMPLVTGGPKSSEQDLLYKLLLALQRELQALKQLLYEHLRGGASQEALLARYAPLFAASQEEPLPLRLAQQEQQAGLIPLLPGQAFSGPVRPPAGERAQAKENLSLKDKEAEYIIRAFQAYPTLDQAAQALGFSKRTLHRKLKKIRADKELAPLLKKKK